MCILCEARYFTVITQAFLTLVAFLGSVALARDKQPLSNARDKQYKQNSINKMGSPLSAHQKEGMKPSRSGGEPAYFFRGDSK